MIHRKYYEKMAMVSHDTVVCIVVFHIEEMLIFTPCKTAMSIQNFTFTFVTVDVMFM